MEDAERSALRQRAEPIGLVPRRDEEIAAAGGGERVDCQMRANAIAIGLDRRAARRPRAIRQPAPVAGERGGIDAKAKRAVHWRGHGRGA